MDRFGLHANISWVYAALLVSVGAAQFSAALVSSLITPYAYIVSILWSSVDHNIVIVKLIMLTINRSF